MYDPYISTRNNYVRWTPIAQYVLDHAPALYNPLGSTFNSRLNNIDGGYSYDTPLIYWDSRNGRIKKILASLKDKDMLLENYYSPDDPDWLDQKVNGLSDKQSYISESVGHRIYLR